jgi:ParB/RepB/Spo0J family partition protein
MKDDGAIEEMAISAIGEKYAVFRIINPRADNDMEKSMLKYGQLSPVVCVKIGSGYEMIDGFKRLRACRRMKRATITTKILAMTSRVCKAAIIQLNHSSGAITGMEEAMVLQSLYRDDALMQTEIAVLLGRHKSWVSRRISLIERLSEEVQEDIRLGLISISVGQELAKLPRRNQQETLSAVRKHRLNKREVVKLISHLLCRPTWEYQAKQPKPVGLEAKLKSFEHACRSLSERLKGSRIESYLYEPIERAMGAAEEIVQTLKAVSTDTQAVL